MASMAGMSTTSPGPTATATVSHATVRPPSTSAILPQKKGGLTTKPSARLVLQRPSIGSQIQRRGRRSGQRSAVVRGQATETVGVPENQILNITETELASSDSPPSELVRNPESDAVTEARELDQLAKELSESRTFKADGESKDPKAPPLSIVFVASEVAPWSKTGGLADVVGSLPGALAKRGHRVMVIAPRYGEYVDAVDTEVRTKVWCFGSDHQVGYFHAVKDGVDFIFVDNPGAYLRAGTPYGDAHGDFGDNQFRFTLLALAALEAPLIVPINGELYGQDCMFVVNDWHAAMVSVYLVAKYRRHGVYLGARCILCIHNCYHQGVFPPGMFGNLGLPSDWYGCMEYQYPVWARKGSYAEEGRSLNYLKAGISTADRIIAVSPGYSHEIRTPLGGWNLDAILANRSYHMDGILNGIDTTVWSPEADTKIAKNYSAATFEDKLENKLALQAELGLPQRKDVPVIGFIGRLDYQKGADLIAGALGWMMNMDVQLVMLGSGDPALENILRSAESNHRDKARGWVGFNPDMAHKITAGCDLLLMPSRFEPCGLNQLYAMRYGTCPVAHSTGGLRDSVIDWNPSTEEGTGWTFSPATVEGLQHALGTALHTYWNYPEAFRQVQLNGMKQDFSWERAANEYEQAFRWAKMDLPYCG